MLTDKIFRKGLKQLLVRHDEYRCVEIETDNWLVSFRPNITTICDPVRGLGPNDPLFTTSNLFSKTNEFLVFIDELYARDIETKIYDFIEGQMLIEM